MSKAAAAATRELTWMEEAIEKTPDQVLYLNPDDPNELIIDTEPREGHPYGRNSRKTPPIGDKSLRPLIESMERLTRIDANGNVEFNGQLTPCAATFNDDGIPSLYFGFQRARAIQSRNAALDKGAEPIRLRVIVTPTELTPQQIRVMSLAENTIRRDPTLMEIAVNVGAMQDEGMVLTDISKAINKSVGSVSVYSRMNLFPANAQRALNTTPAKLSYNNAEKLATLLPKEREYQTDGVFDEERYAADLKAAQKKIAARVDKLLSAGSAVERNAAADDVERRDGSKRQRTTRQVMSLIAEKLPEDKSEDTKALTRLRAVITFIKGGSIAKLIKALE